MLSLIKLILICFIVITAEWFCLAAQANTIDLSSSDVVALAKPSTAEMANAKNRLMGEIHSAATDNRFIPGAAIYASSFSGDEASRLERDGIYIGTSSSRDYIDLEGGNILLNPERDMLIGTHSGSLHVGAGAIVFIVNSGEDLVVYDLLQNNAKQVYAIVNKQKVYMEPGRLLVLTKEDTADFEKLAIDCHRVPYRNTVRLDKVSQPGNTVVFAADFSIASAMATIQPLKRLTVSKNQQDSLDVQRILKSALLLDSFSSSFDQVTSEDSAVATIQADQLQVSANNNH